MFKRKRQPTLERRGRSPDFSAQRQSPVFSYHANRSVREGGSQYRDAFTPEEQESLKKESIPWRKRLISVVILVLFIGIVFSCLQLSSNVRIVPVGTSDGQVFLRDTNVYTQKTDQEFSSFANSNKLTVNAAQITNELEATFPELKAVSVSLPIVGNRPVVYIQPATPKLILMSKDGMYVLDANGRALIAGSQVLKLQQLNIPVVTDQSGLSIQIGRIALPHDTVSFITEFVGQLKAKGLAVSSLILPPATNDLTVKINGAGYDIKTSLHGDVRAEAGTFLAAKQFLDEQHKVPTQYVDVRVEQKVFYK